MRRFIVESTLFLLLLLGLLVFSAFILPNVGLEQSMYYALLDKHKALVTKRSPKIVLVGGSNLSFGLDSQQIQEAFGMNVVNMGLHAGLGLRYIMNELTPFIQRGDFIIVVPEYDHFVKGEQATLDGKIELLYVLFDVFPDGRKFVSTQQWLSLGKLVPHYASRKMVDFAKFQLHPFRERTKSEPFKIGAYERRAFNEFGDVVAHWKLEPQAVDDYLLEGEVEGEAIFFLNEYKKVVEQKGAKIFFLYPSIRELAYQQSEDFINRLSTELRKSLKVEILTEPERALFRDEHIFDTPYHLSKSGVDLRTKMLIEDIQNYIRVDES